MCMVFVCTNKVSIAEDVPLERVNETQMRICMCTLCLHSLLDSYVLSPLLPSPSLHIPVCTKGFVFQQKCHV